MSALDYSFSMENNQPPVELRIRKFTSTDHAFVLDSWSRSFRHGAASDKIPPDIYKFEQRARIARILKYSTVRVLHSASSPTNISGWICFSEPNPKRLYPTLHYILVHPNLQMKGVGSSLFKECSKLRASPDDPILCTHWTLPMRKLISRWNLIYNPYLLEISK